MCNYFKLASNQAEITLFTRALRDISRNLEPDINVYKNSFAPIVRNGTDGVREMATMQFGLPTDPKHLVGKNYDPGQSNIRNSHFPWWRQYHGLENRCVVPVTSFAEPAPYKDEAGKTPNVFFALDQTKPLFFFAGMWTQWTGVRRVKDGPGDFTLFGFLTTDPNNVVKPIHPKAMPVILRTPEEVDHWMTAPFKEALQLQKPLPDDTLLIVN